MNKYNLKLFAFVDFKSVQFDGFWQKRNISPDVD